MKIKLKQNWKKRPKFLYGVEQEIKKKQGRLAQLNKFHKHRAIYG